MTANLAAVSQHCCIMARQQSTAITSNSPLYERKSGTRAVCNAYCQCSQAFYALCSQQCLTLLCYGNGDTADFTPNNKVNCSCGSRVASSMWPSMTILQSAQTAVQIGAQNAHHCYVKARQGAGTCCLSRPFSDSTSSSRIGSSAAMQQCDAVSTGSCADGTQEYILTAVS